MLYQTDDMESAIRTMAARNHHTVVNTMLRNTRRIRMRGNMVADLPNIYWTQAMASDLPKHVAAWRESGGVLFYRGTWIRDNLPPADALLFIECPHQHLDYENLAERIAREIVIYRPPTWELHDEAIDTIYPLAWKFQVLDLAIDGMRGRKDLHPRLEAAIRFRGIGPVEAMSAFTVEDLSIVSGFSEVEVSRLLRSRQYLRMVVGYKCFVPQCEPDDPDTLGMYRILESEPDVYDGVRMLRSFELAAHFKPETRYYRVRGFKTFLLAMIRSGDVGKLPDIYVAGPIKRSKAWSMLWNAQMKARRENWAKMRDLVDRAPTYTLSERAVPILYAERLPDTIDLVPPLPDADQYFV